MHPLSFMSDRTPLSNYASDMKEWPVFMTSCNVSSKICQMTLKHSIIIVALLPITINNRNILQKRLHEQWQTTWEVLNEILQRVLHPLNLNRNLSTKSGYYNVLCADCDLRRCKPASAVSLTDCPEYGDIHHLERHVCFWCECPKNEPGDYVAPDNQHPWRHQNLYRMLRDAKIKGADVELSSRYAHQGFNEFRHIPCIVSDLPKADLLDTLQISILDHIPK
jgi:hypothetical protein